MKNIKKITLTIGAAATVVAPVAAVIACGSSDGAKAASQKNAAKKLTSGLAKTVKEKGFKGLVDRLKTQTYEGFVKDLKDLTKNDLEYILDKSSLPKSLKDLAAGHIPSDAKIKSLVKKVLGVIKKDTYKKLKDSFKNGTFIKEVLSIPAIELAIQTLPFGKIITDLPKTVNVLGDLIDLVSKLLPHISEIVTKFDEINKHLVVDVLPMEHPTIDLKDIISYDQKNSTIEFPWTENGATKNIFGKILTKNLDQTKSIYITNKGVFELKSLNFAGFTTDIVDDLLKTENGVLKTKNDEHRSLGKALETEVEAFGKTNKIPDLMYSAWKSKILRNDPHGNQTALTPAQQTQVTNAFKAKLDAIKAAKTAKEVQKKNVDDATKIIKDAIKAEVVKITAAKITKDSKDYYDKSKFNDTFFTAIKAISVNSHNISLDMAKLKENFAKITDAQTNISPTIKELLQPDAKVTTINGKDIKYKDLSGTNLTLKIQPYDKATNKSITTQKGAFIYVEKMKAILDVIKDNKLMAGKDNTELGALVAHLQTISDAVVKHKKELAPLNTEDLVKSVIGGTITEANDAILDLVLYLVSPIGYMKEDEAKKIKLLRLGAHDIVDMSTLNNLFKGDFVKTKDLFGSSLKILGNKPELLKTISGSLAKLPLIFGEVLTKKITNADGDLVQDKLVHIFDNSLKRMHVNQSVIDNVDKIYKVFGAPDTMIDEYVDGNQLIMENGKAKMFDQKSAFLARGLFTALSKLILPALTGVQIDKIDKK